MTMKLFELLDPDAWDEEGPNAPYLKRKGPKSVVAAANKLRAEDPDHKYVASGSYAYVGRRDTPHDMDRVTRLGPKKDGAAVYLKVVQQAGLHNNPYLPRLLARPKVSGNVQTAQIERLLPFKTPKIITNIELMESMWERWFSTPLPSNVRVVVDSPEEFAFDFPDEVSVVLNDYLSRGGNDHIRDQQLKQALDFILNLMEEHNLSEDLHPENMMWRMTGTMPQMVITDPVQTFLADDEM
jgi:hypothetical protein